MQERERLSSLLPNLVSCLQLLDFSPLLMTGNELNPGDHLGGSEPQNHKLELRKVGHIKLQLLQQKKNNLQFSRGGLW